jgi:hypothetical protein
MPGARTTTTSTPPSTTGQIGRESDYQLTINPAAPQVESAMTMDGVRTYNVARNENRDAAGPVVMPIPTDNEHSPSAEAEIICRGLNEHRGLGIEDPVIATPVKGDTAPVTDIDPNTGWLHVELSADEKSGWISGKPVCVRIRAVLKLG